MNKTWLRIMILSVALFVACGKGADGPASKQKPIARAVTAPSQPADISTLASDGQVVVRWAASPGAESYNVYLSDKEGQPLDKATKVGVKETSYEHKYIKNGAVYYYRVSAMNKAGESAASGETGAMPKSVPPGAPTGVAAMGGTGAIAVKWTPVPGASSYNVYFSVKPQLPKEKRMKIADIKAPPFEHKDVKKKTMYFYMVSAVNPGGESPLSAESGAMP